MTETPTQTRLATVTARCIDAQDWRDAWTDGASWPFYILEIQVDGQPVGTIRGWHFYSPTPAPPDGGVGDLGRPHDEDSHYCGLPQPYDADGWRLHLTGEPISGVTIEPGDNLDGELTLPTHAPDGTVLLYSPGELIRAIQSAADEADHGPDPDLADALTYSHSNLDYLYTIQDYRVVEVEVRRYEAFPCDDGSLIVAYTCDDSDPITYGELLEDLGQFWSDEYEAQNHLIRKVAPNRLRELATPPDLAWKIDSGQIAVYLTSDSSELYHLSDSELASLCMHGWSSILEDLEEALGTLPEALREHSPRLDRLVEDLNPFVGIEDSLLAGNCRSGSEDFAHRMAKVLRAQGPIGAVRALEILALRDDVYTRRACRQAALRLSGGRTHPQGANI